MRTWVEVYNQSSVKVAFVERSVSATVGVRLDEAGTFELQCVVDEKVVDYLIRDNEVAIYTQEDTEPPKLEMRGKIIKARVQETGDNITISISGRDLLEELRWKTVGLGRTYNAQTVQAIMNDLTSLVTGWTANVETAVAALLQTARFDGPKVLKAILKSADQLGIHIRNGTGTRVLDVGAFGAAATTPNGVKIRAIKPPSSVSPALYDNDAVLLVDSISVTEDGDTLVNWAIPMGAGEGSAATTLKDTSYTILDASDNSIYRGGTPPDYPIYRHLKTDNRVEYYVDASDGETQHQDTLSFKTIGPVANSDLAKIDASDALAKACFESLRRTRIPLISYSVSVRKAQVALRPGDMIRLTYQGNVTTYNDPRATRGEVSYIDVDEDLWVMGVQRNISDSGITTTLQVNTIDQHIKDDTDIVVELLDRSEVRNLSIQTMPFGFQDSSERVIQGALTPVEHDYRTADFSLTVPDIFTDVVKVSLQVLTRPLYTLTNVGPIVVPSVPWLGAADYRYQVYNSTNYPSDVRLAIDGVDVTDDLGGPWNPSEGNSPIDVTLDISNYIIEASGGLYQNHTLVFSAGSKVGDSAVESGILHPASPPEYTSHGVLEAKILFLGNVRGLF